tara:strand:- start:791 stop:1579 length:789 start_codon:yes stop_codon:yes gene_type:complete
VRHKLLNIHYLGGNGGEFLASYLQRHREFNQHETDKIDDITKYEFKRDRFDHHSHIYLGLGTHKCLAHYSPRKFLQELWTTSNDKWTLRIDHGYGYVVQEDQWIKGLYSDWNVSKTIILNTTEYEGSKFCRDLAQIKVFGKGTHTMSETAAFNQPKAYAVNRLSPLLREFSTFDLGDIWETPLEFNLFATQRYKDLIPEPHDWLHIDPMKLLHTEDEDEREAQLIKIFDYLGFDYSIVDIGMLLCEKYMQDNKKLHKKRGFS